MKFHYIVVFFLANYCLAQPPESIVVHFDRLGLELFDDSTEQYTALRELYFEEVVPQALRTHDYEELPLSEDVLVVLKYETGIEHYEALMAQRKTVNHQQAKEAEFLYSTLGQAYLRVKHYSKAEATFWKYAALTEGTEAAPLALYELADMRLVQKDHDGYVSLMEKAINTPKFLLCEDPSLMSRHLDMLSRLGSFFIRTGDHERGVNYYNAYFEAAHSFGIVQPGRIETAKRRLGEVSKAVSSEFRFWDSINKDTFEQKTFDEIMKRPSKNQEEDLYRRMIPNLEFMFAFDEKKPIDR